MEYIAYEGEKFVIEWYFDENSECEVLEYFEKNKGKVKGEFIIIVH